MSNKYKQINRKGKVTYEHREIWEAHHGPIPDKMRIDHINGDKRDNRIENLRCVTNSRNLHNSLAYKGFSYHKKAGKWDARIMVDGVLHTLGLHETPVDARAAYLRKYRELLGADFNGRA